MNDYQKNNGHWIFRVGYWIFLVVLNFLTTF